MVKSMTGYGRAREMRSGRDITVEVRSVNNRYLDCTVKLPRAYIFAEDAIKTRVQKGTLSIDSENIFPIIKKWVYSDHDIFVRELVSNGCDAITKLKKLDMMGEYELPEGYKPKIEVIVNPEEKTMKFIDNGLGMTAEEVEEYITQIAFSGATQFLEKYKDKTTEDDMIVRFGNAAGSLTTTKGGAIPAMPSMVEIQNCIASIPLM